MRLAPLELVLIQRHLFIIVHIVIAHIVIRKWDSAHRDP
jgi:hypothetical protein